MLAIGDLAVADPQNADRHADLALGLENIGDVLLARADDAAALARRR